MNMHFVTQSNNIHRANCIRSCVEINPTSPESSQPVRYLHLVDCIYSRRLQLRIFQFNYKLIKGNDVASQL